jgi:Ca-activated chloride channel family protein
MSFTELSLIRILIVIGATIAIVISAYLFFVHNQKFYKKNKNLSHHLRPKWLQIIFLSSSLLILFLTLLGPKGGTQTENVSYDGIDMIIALDVSQSMNVADITVENKITTRLLAAKQLLKEFVTDHPQDRFGLTVFAGDATSICPLTQDHEILLTFMDGVDHNNATSQGTNLLAALSLAMERFRDPERSKAIVLISDGGDDPFTDSLHEIKSYREENNITLATIGIGTDKGGHIIEGQDRFGRVQYKTYK